MSDAKPFPKSAQLARGERRYRRKVASPKSWQAILAAKRGPCRACNVTSVPHLVEYHHIVKRGAPYFGDDVADNIVPLHPYCHLKVTLGRNPWLRRLAESLSDSERAYVVGKLGEDGLVRLFGATR